MGWDRYRARVALFTRYLGLHPTRQAGAPEALHPIDERAGY